MYTRDSKSLSKHDPPKPTLHYKNLLPIRESLAIIALTSFISQPGVTSHSSVIEFMLETLYASIALAINLPNSLLDVSFALII